MRRTMALAGIFAACATFASAQDAGMSFFITSTNPGQGADLGGLEGADAHCAELAEAAGVTGFGPGIAYYEDAGKGDGSVLVHAGMTVPEGTVVEGVDVHVLPGIEQAATIVHRGSMDNILPTVQTLARWMETNGYQSEHYARELYLECPEDRSQWVTEIQEAITRA